MSTKQKQVAKTFTYGIMHMGVAFLVAMALTGSWKLALSISLVEPIVQTFCYYLHEKAWSKITDKPFLISPCGGHAGLIRP